MRSLWSEKTEEKSKKEEEISFNKGRYLCICPVFFEGGIMSKIPEEVKDFLKNHLAYVATVNENGIPNVVPKGDIAILNDNTVVFADLYHHQTRKNLTKNANIAITVVNPAAYRGYQLKGKAKIVEHGKEYDSLAKQAYGNGQLDNPGAKYAVKVKVTKIIDVGYGETADKGI